MPIGTSPVAAKQLAEKISRYRRDFRAFANEQLKIFGQPLDFWPCQEPLILDIEKQFAERGFARCVWLKARQVGSSTLAQAYVAWRTMLWPHISAIVIADEAERSRTLFEICRSFYDQMDDDVRPIGRYVTKRELVFANPNHATRQADPGLRSRVVVESAHKKNIAIGTAWQVAHLSEVARFRDPNFVIDGLIPAVHRVPGTIVIMESTAEMAGAWYRQFCEDSMKGRTAFHFSFVPWYLQPEYQIPLGPKEKMDFDAEERHMMAEYGLTPMHIKWMREKLAEMNGDWALFRQNFPLSPEDAWITPGVQVFPTKVLRELASQVRPPIRRVEMFPGPRALDGPQGRLLIWEEPQPGKAYDMGVDVAMGTAETEDDPGDLDSSIMCILERGTNKQVAEWSGKTIDPFELANAVYWVGLYYNTAQVAVETNAIGMGTNQQLSKMGYPNQYIWRYRDEIVPRYSKKTGWETNMRSKPWLVGFAGHEGMHGRIEIRSELLYKEMEAFVQKGPREWGAVAGYHDDRVMAWMIALIASDDESFEKYYGIRKMINGPAKGDDALANMPQPWECDSTFNRGLGLFEKSSSPWD